MAAINVLLLNAHFCCTFLDAHNHAGNIIVIADYAAGTKEFPMFGMNKSLSILF